MSTNISSHFESKSAVAGTINSLLDRWEPPAPVAADGDIITGIDYRTATTMKIAFRLVADSWARVGEVPMVGRYTGFDDGLLVWLQNGHCRVGFFDNDTGTVRLNDQVDELEILWIEFYKRETFEPQTSTGTGTGGDTTITARYQANTPYVTDDPILEPWPGDGEIYVWRADGDFTSGPDPDFDGTGFTRQERATNPIGIETHILNSDSTPRLFAGSGIAKAIDITQDQQLMPREFRPELATQIYGSDGGGKIGTAIDPSNGYMYAVRAGRTITNDTLPSLSNDWILVYPGVVPPNGLADILAIPFASLVAFTGSMLYAVDTHELLMWDTGATPENVAPRRTYAAAAEPIPFVQGKWVVISPQPGGEDTHVLLAEAAGTTGGTVVNANESMTAIKNNYRHLEFYSLSDGFGNPIQTSGGLLLTEHLTDGVPFRVDVAGRALIFTPTDNGAANMTLANGSAGAGAQNMKIFGVKKQTTVVMVDAADFVVDLAGVADGDGAAFADDGAGGFKLVKEPAPPPTTPTTVTLNGVTDTDSNSTIPYAGEVTRGYLIEIEFSTDRWIPQGYGDRIDEAVVYFQALYDKGLAQFELHVVGIDLQNKPYRVTIYQEPMSVGTAQVHNTLAELPAPATVLVGTEAKVVNDAANNGTYTATGANVGAPALAWVKG